MSFTPAEHFQAGAA